MKSKIIVLYIDEDGSYTASSFDKDDKQRIKMKIDEINISKNKKLLWLVEGSLLNIVSDGEDYIY